MYTGLSVYRIKKEALELITSRFPEVQILNEEALCEMSYLFIPDTLSVSAVKANMLGSYIEMTFPISETEVEKLMASSRKSKPSPNLWSIGHLAGFGKVPLLVTAVMDGEIELLPISSNLFKVIVAHVDDFEMCEEQVHTLTYAYNLELSIDCDIFPYLKDNSYAIYKRSLSQLIYNLHNLLPKLKVYLLNPCPIMLMVGASLGISESKEPKPNILSVKKGSSVRVNASSNFSILEVGKLTRSEEQTGTVTLKDLYSINRYFKLSGVLDPYETSALLSRMFFETKTMLNISLSYNPLGDE